MAAPRQIPSHIVRLKPSCSTDSSFTRTPVPTVSLASRELPVSSWQVTEPSSKNLWEQICKGCASRGNAFSWLQCRALFSGFPFHHDLTYTLSSR
ncbi:IQ motif containing K [Homo sapiens]|uniref:IQ motif containing K n=1 Tax=Homo sapiens TaxID=9606 RepID=H3BRX5_HUMAN|nr:IQ motif containing K [Homo sapiens]KAI2577455.1 IQ motif containing K [Homo sapiens]KAI4053862.1 IQ motif containing K [Homo sapiens]KAI4053863.1 IQ motif containing K [Homo sapiens]